MTPSSRFSRIGAALPGILAGAFVGKAAVQLAVEVDRAIVTGRTVGLTEAEAREVVEACRLWASERGSPVPWDEVRAAMIRRAMGEEWQP